ncbi:MAG: hypothetical protein KDA84_11305 [Planctomycetaceae bacterium]|nr:hypothetical protein [Planctomycetaceae bacterium]
MQQFIKKHESQVFGVLNGFDRLRFRGTLRVLCVVQGLFSWMNHQRVLLKQFKEFSLSLTSQLKASIESVAEAAGRKIEYVAASSLSKEALVQELLRREKTPEGLVCVLSCVEPCQSFDIERDKVEKTIDLVSRPRKCLHWYLYFIHPVWGLCHVRIQSWLPFTVHVCVNGREWLCRDLANAGIGFQRRDNCLTWVEDLSAAQQMLEAQPWFDWSGELQRLLERACPALGELRWGDRALTHYWSAAETEWASDVMFRSRSRLESLYPALRHHAITTFGSSDVLRFLGKKITAAGDVPGNFRGEVVTDLKTRPEGTRIKHRLKANSIKMYDKQGSVLRVETTINAPGDFQVYRASEADPDGPKSRRKMRRGVVELPARAKASQAANRRYLESLAAVDSATPLARILEPLSKPVVTNGHRSRGLHPLVGNDARLAECLLKGEFALHGFRNRQLRVLLFGESDDPAQVRRDSAKTGRLLRLFRDHNLIYRVKGTHRYQLSARGRRTLPNLLAIRTTNAKKLHELAI